MKRLLFLLGFALLASATVHAHHSFAPHFDRDKPVSIAGTVIEYEQRNPHSYLHILSMDDNGRSQEYICESHGVTQLSRNGITPDMLQAGTELRVEGSQHRRDPKMCFFDSVHFPDGRILNVNGATQPTEESPVAQRDSIFGTWLMLRQNRSTSGPQEMMAHLTPAGEAAVAAYNPFQDDPTFRCEPVALRRGWFAIDTPMAIRRQGQDIIIQHEWMDIERTIHMNESRIPESVDPAILGYSIGHFEGETLVIESGAFTQGVLNQYVEEPGKATRGLLHSDQLRTVERIRFLPEQNSISLSIEHYDPVFFNRDFPPATAQYRASDLEIKKFGCIPQLLK